MNKRFQSYYTRNKYIKIYMIDQLNINNNDKILEPAGGTGEFIDSLLATNKNVNIDTFDIDSSCIHILHDKYNRKKNVHIKQSNTLFDPQLDKITAEGGKYNKIISNPPYGAWLSFKERKDLKKKFGKLYTKETYLLFLIRSIYLLKNNGILSFIIPDTFLYLRTYRYIREFLLNHTKIMNILIFPSYFFTGINFKYSHLSIITLQRCNNITQCQNNIVNIYKNFKSTKDFVTLNGTHDHFIKLYNKQINVLQNINNAFILDKDTNNLIKCIHLSLGDIASCVTGIYTGNNKKYIALVKNTNTHSNKYNYISKNKIDFHCTSLHGIHNNSKYYVPIAKGSSKNKYRRCLKWAIKWKPSDVKFFNTNKKARFQNSKYYFRHGIAIPMVKSKMIKATEINNVVFDQSLVCIFLKDKKYFNYLLGLLNTKLINKIIHCINPTVNNSANYLKRIPIVLPSTKQLISINIIVNRLKVQPNNIKEQQKLNNIINDIY